MPSGTVLGLCFAYVVEPRPLGASVCSDPGEGVHVWDDHFNNSLLVFKNYLVYDERPHLHVDYPTLEPVSAPIRLLNT